MKNINKLRNFQGKKQINNSLPNKDSISSTLCFEDNCIISSFALLKIINVKNTILLIIKTDVGSSQKVKSKTNDVAKNQNVKMIKVNQVASNVNRKYVNITINNHPIKLQLDIRSDIIIILEKSWFLLGKPKGCIISYVVRDASGNHINFNQEIT